MLEGGNQTGEKGIQQGLERGTHIRKGNPTNVRVGNLINTTEGNPTSVVGFGLEVFRFFYKSQNCRRLKVEPLDLPQSNHWFCDV